MRQEQLAEIENKSMAVQGRGGVKLRMNQRDISGAFGDIPIPMRICLHAL